MTSTLFVINSHASQCTQFAGTWERWSLSKNLRTRIAALPVVGLKFRCDGSDSDAYKMLDSAVKPDDLSAEIHPKECF